MDNSLIKHQAAIDAWRADFKGYVDCLDLPRDDYNGIMEYINEAPSAQTEITLESAIDYLHKIGWMQEHDRILTESAQPEQLERCPIYDGVCGYPSDQCYECPRHYGAKVASGMEMPSAQPELSDVAVSAMAVEEMLKDLLPERGMWEIEGDEAKTAICEVIRDALEGLWKLPFVKPNSKESSLTQKELDTISRRAALDALDGEIEITGRTNAEAVKGYVRLVRDRLERLPSAQPERPKGEWITDDLSGIISCSRCGNDAPMETTGGGQYKSKFCPNCGADMRGEQIKELLETDVVTVFEVLKAAHDKIKEWSKRSEQDE